MTSINLKKKLGIRKELQSKKHWEKKEAIKSFSNDQLNEKDVLTGSYKYFVELITQLTTYTKLNNLKIYIYKKQKKKKNCR